MLAGCGEKSAYVMPPEGRLKPFLRGLVKLVAIVSVAGGVGVALGMGLSKLSDAHNPAPAADAGPVGSPDTSSTAMATALPPATPTTSSPATPPDDPPSPLEHVSVSVLDARLFTDETPSGRVEQRARVTVRIRAENAGDRRLTLSPPTLRVGSVRVPVEPDATAPGARFDPLAAGTTQTVTLRFAVAGEATPKLVRDRRARILIAGRSVAIRVRVQAPANR